MEQDTRKLLTHSSMNAAKSCLRRYYYQYVLQVEPFRPQKALTIGSAFHLGLDIRANGFTIEEAITGAIASYDETPPPSQAEGWYYDWLVNRERLIRMLVGYFWRWGAEEIKYVATEQEFKLELINPETGRASKKWILAGKMDKIIKYPSGMLALMEHKSTGSPIEGDSDYWTKLRIDQQISLYYIAAWAKGFEITTIIYDVAFKPRMQPKQIPALDDEGRKIVHDEEGHRVWKDSEPILSANKKNEWTVKKDGKDPVLDDQGRKIVEDKNGQRVFKEARPIISANKEKGHALITEEEETGVYGDRIRDDQQKRPDFYFQRREIPRIEADIKEAQFDNWHTGQILSECHRHDRWPRNTSACIAPFKCPFFDVCAGSYDMQSKDVPEGFVKKAHTHTELSSPDVEVEG